MAERVLTGLRGSHTLGALAAFGLLRVASRVALPQPVKLGWTAQPDWTARLTFPEPVTDEALLKQLGEVLKDRTVAPELNWREDLKAMPEEYRGFARQQLEEASPDQRESVDFLAAFGSERVLMKNASGLRPTALDMTSASNKFLRDLHGTIHKLAGARDRSARLAEALFGPWRQQDNVFAMGWNCEAERMHAYAAMAPTKAKHESVIGAIWLAYEALPLFPTASVGGRLATAGFDARNRYLTWPIWEAPLALPAVRSLLGLAGLSAEQPDLALLRWRGIRALYRAQRAELMQGRATLRSPVVL